MLDGRIAEDEVEGTIGKHSCKVAGICLDGTEVSLEVCGDQDESDVHRRHVKCEIEEPPYLRRTPEIKDTSRWKQASEPRHLRHSLRTPAADERMSIIPVESLNQVAPQHD
jgi:hypothetical protein